MEYQPRHETTTLLDTGGDFNLITSKIYKNPPFKKGNKIPMNLTTANNTTRNIYDTLILRSNYANSTNSFNFYTLLTL